jgi:hypothetical protein
VEGVLLSMPLQKGYHPCQLVPCYPTTQMPPMLPLPLVVAVAAAG